MNERRHFECHKLEPVRLKMYGLYSLTLPQYLSFNALALVVSLGMIVFFHELLFATHGFWWKLLEEAEKDGVVRLFANIPIILILLTGVMLIETVVVLRLFRNKLRILEDRDGEL